MSVFEKIGHRPCSIDVVVDDRTNVEKREWTVARRIAGGGTGRRLSTPTGRLGRVRAVVETRVGRFVRYRLHIDVPAVVGDPAEPSLPEPHRRSIAGLRLRLPLSPLSSPYSAIATHRRCRTVTRPFGVRLATSSKPAARNNGSDPV